MVKKKIVSYVVIPTDIERYSRGFDMAIFPVVLFRSESPKSFFCKYTLKQFKKTF